MSKKWTLRQATWKWTLRQATWKTCQRSVEICGIALDQSNWSLPNQSSWKKSLLLTCKILVLLVNTLAADEKYPVLNRDNLTIPIQIKLSREQKTFSHFFAPFLKLA